MKFITQTDIKNWAEKDCQTLLPELVRRLIHASGQEFELLTMPSGDGVALSGWDGILKCRDRIFTIDSGLSLWEIGSDKDVTRKAESDYKKRTTNTSVYNSKDATFVFVTPRIWTKANRWVQEKRAEGKWKNVVVYTAVELEDWIEQYPAVGIWLANHFGKLKNKNLETPEMFWERWSKGKDYSIFPSCILGGRADIIEKVCNCIRFPQVLRVQAHSRKEAMAFIVASLLKEGAEKSIVVSDIEDTRYLVNNYKNTIIVTYAIDSWEFATKNGNSVIIAASQEEQINGAEKLPAIERNAFIQSLEESGIEHEKAIRLATMTGRNIMTLRRELGIDSQKPQWATADKMNIYLPMVLLGRWNGKAIGDRDLVEIMSGCNYLEYENELQKELTKDDCPFVHIGDDWQILSAFEVYRYCTSFISTLYLERFEKVVEKIIFDADPEINRRIDNNSLFIPQRHSLYSGRIKYGVFYTLIFLSLDEDKNAFSQKVLRKYLQKGTTEQILSLEHYFPLIAEAAPEVFIELIEKDFGNGSKIINQLFKYNPDCFTFGPIGHYHNLLFSLEALAWDTSRMTQIADILIRLLSYPVPSNNAQKPLESLKNIFRYVLPQTFVPCKDRIKIHGRLCKKYPNYAYILSMLVVKSLTDNIYNLNYTFTWRDYDKEPLKEGKRYPLFEDVDVIVTRVLEYCEYTTEQVCELLSISAHGIMDPWRKLILEQIGNHQEKLAGDKEICNAIRQIILNDYRYTNRKSNSKKDDVSLYNKLLDILSPKDVVQQNVWLFENEWVNVRQSAEFDYDKEEIERKKLREKALKEVLDKKGIQGIIAMAEKAGDTFCLGRVFGTLDKEEHYSWFVEQYQTNKTLCKFVSGYIIGTALGTKGNTISFETILKLSQMIPEHLQQVAVLALLPYDPLVGDYIDTLEQNAQDEYWKNTRAGIGSDIERVINRLNSVRRYATAIEYIAMSLENDRRIVPDETMYDTLMLFAKNGMHGARGGIGYNIHKIINHLDKSTSPKVQDNIIMLELVFFDAHKGHDNMGQKLRILKDMLSDANVMIQFIDASSLPDGEEEIKNMLQKLEKDPWANFLHKTINHIMWDFQSIPYADDNGKVNYTALKNYVERLLTLGKEHHHICNTRDVVGKLLANIPIQGECADEELCDLLDCLANDNIDNAYRTQIFYSRGVVTRGPYQGGDSEFALETRYRKIANNAIGYTHLPKIYRALAEDYHSMGTQEDNDAQLMQLRY